MTRKERFDDMEKALRANCPCEYVLDEIPFDFYAVNMVYHGWGNIEQALTEFAEKLKERSFWQCDSNGNSHKVIYPDDIDKTLQEFLNSLNNQAG